MSENKKHWLLYDGTCRFCLGMVNRWRGTLECRGFGFAALQDEWVRERLDLPEEELLREMRVLTRCGKVLGAADAFAFLWGKIWWCWPLWILAHIPGVRWLINRAYRWVAAHRNCLGGTCSLHDHSVRPARRWALPGWLPIAVFPALVIGFKEIFAEPWVFMWALAVVLFISCKWLTLWLAWTRGAVIGVRRALGYLFLWPGMDVKPFTCDAEAAVKPAGREWFPPLAKTAVGVVLIWGLGPLEIENDVLAGWCGMTGLILLLHFGSFHLLALAWRSWGVAAEPIMDSPVTSTSLSRFWSERWNRGFNELVHTFFFRTTYRRIGVTGAMFLVFLVSGLVHDLVISLPAGKCYGLPTAYFLLQGLGVLLERSGPGRRIGLNHGLLGWVYMAAFTMGPVYWLLFPVPFIKSVINPFLEVIGAI